MSNVAQFSADGLWKMVAMSWHMFWLVPNSKSSSLLSNETRAFVAWRSLLGREEESILSVFATFLSSEVTLIPFSLWRYGVASTCGWHTSCKLFCPPPPLWALPHEVLSSYTCCLLCTYSCSPFFCHCRRMWMNLVVRVCQFQQWGQQFRVLYHWCIPLVGLN